MDFQLKFLGGIFLFLFLLVDSLQDVHVGVDLVTKLSNNLIQAIFKEASTQNENIITSPFGVLSTLAMILEASNDKTKEEILKALNISSSEVGSLRKGFKAYCDLFLKYSGEPEAAGSFNSASFASSFKLNATFEDVLRKNYCANVSESLTGDDAVLDLGSIAGVMSHWKDYEKLAVYTFLSHQSLRPFRRKNGSVLPVPMIPQVGVFRASRWENSRVVLLPLQSKLVSLLLVIPDEAAETEVVLKKLTEYGIPQLVQSSPKQELEVFIPQMAIVNKNLNLTSVFVRNGITRAFDGNKSELSKAAFEPEAKVAVRSVSQNAYFSTSFVALNSVSGATATLESHKRSKRDARKVYVDRPFLFFVLQKDTQLVLLAGKVETPLQIPA